MTNQGVQAAAASTTRYYLSLDGAKSNNDLLLTGSRAVPSLAVGATSSSGDVTLSIPSTVALGGYFLLACADDTLAVIESDETNNCKSSEFMVSVTAPPLSSDLAESSIGNPPVSVTAGGNFSATDSVSNLSSTSASASTTRYYLSLDTLKSASDKLLTGSRAVPALAAGAASTGSTTVTVPTTVAAGSYYLIACADDRKQVTESNETNNCLASTSTVLVGAPALADLVESSLANPPASAALGVSFSVSDTVLNQGGATANATSTRYYLSSDTLKSTNDKLLTGARAVPSLAALAASTGGVTVTVPTSTSLGNYYLIACADDRKQVSESGETNNCTASTSTVRVGP